MKAGYKVVDAVMGYDKIIEVLNREKTNEIIHLGWITPNLAYKCRSDETLGVWKLKQLKN